MITFDKISRFCHVISLILLPCCSFGQTTKLFDISETFQDSAVMRSQASIKGADSSFFSDEQYVVSRTCSGEWGGTVWFKKKRTGIIYSCASSCPVCINKLGGKYYVTSTLAHMSGFSSVLEIDKPDAMNIFKLPKPRKRKGNQLVRYVGDNESKSTQGVKVLLDSMGILTLCSFPYEGELFYIITDFQKTFIAKIAHRHFETIDTISNASIWTYDPSVIKTINNHYIFFFENTDTKGYLDIFENNVALYRYKK
jgi:hypothetical protein